MSDTLEVYKKTIKLNINEENSQLIQLLFHQREKINESIIQWCKGFYKMRDSMDYKVLFHMWKENKDEIYKKQLFELLKKYHLSYDDYKAYNKKVFPQYYEVFYSMNKKVYRRFVDAILNERSLGYFNEKTRKNNILRLTPYNIQGGSNIDLHKGIIDFDLITIQLGIVNTILLEDYALKAYTKAYSLYPNGDLEIELIIENDGHQFDIEYISKSIFEQRLFKKA